MRAARIPELHGYLRTTADLDLVVQFEPDNVRRALEALASLDYRFRAPVPAHAFADADTRRQWVRQKQLTVFSLWSASHPALEVDLFVEEPFDFDAVYARAIRVRLDRTEATLINLDDLLALKRLAGRPVDQQDVATLEALRSDPSDDEWGAGDA